MPDRDRQADSHDGLGAQHVGPAAGTVPALVAVLLAALPWVVPRLFARVRAWLRLRRDHRRRAEAARAAVPAGLRDLVSQLERGFSRAGWPRPSSRGLREHLRTLPAGALSNEARAWSEAVVAFYYGAAFGGRLLAADDIRELERRLEREG